MPITSLSPGNLFPVLAYNHLMDDVDIVKRVQAGDSNAFSLLVEKYHRPLLSFIHRLAGDDRSVEDIGQDVFLNVYKSIRHFDLSEGVPFSAWLFIAARNRCTGEMRRNRPPIVPIDEAEISVREESAEEASIGNERLAAIRASLDRLPEPYRSTILESLNGASLKEIAVRGGISVGTVKSRMFRAKERIRTMLHEYLKGEEP